MEDESKKGISDSLRDWGIDVDRFEVRAKESIETAKGDLTEVTGTLRNTLLRAKDVLLDLQKGGSPAAAELKGGFERAWGEIENAFKSAREKAREARTSAESPATDAGATDAGETDAPVPPVDDENR
ncbi:MAG TPA: hypothetical protein VF701_11185 [Thermoanaerobaculia bacterium]